MIQIDVSISIFEQPGEIVPQLGEIGSPHRIRVPAARHQPEEFRSAAVVGLIQSVTFFDLFHHFAGFHPWIRRRS